LGNVIGLIPKSEGRVPLAQSNGNSADSILKIRREEVVLVNDGRRALGHSLHRAKKNKNNQEALPCDALCGIARNEMKG
jgi:hypothetical protein